MTPAQALHASPKAAPAAGRPKEAARTNRHKAALGQLQAERRLGRALQARRLANRAGDGRVKRHDARPRALKPAGFEHVGLDRQSRLDLVADQLAQDFAASILLDDPYARGATAIELDRPEEVQPPLPDGLTPPRPLGRRRDRPAVR